MLALLKTVLKDINSIHIPDKCQNVVEATVVTDPELMSMILQNAIYKIKELSADENFYMEVRGCKGENGGEGK